MKNSEIAQNLLKAENVFKGTYNKKADDLLKAKFLLHLFNRTYSFFLISAYLLLIYFAITNVGDSNESALTIIMIVIVFLLISGNVILFILKNKLKK